jgi:hypothetical protein
MRELAQTQVAMYDDIAAHLGECDRKQQALLTELGQAKVDLGKAPREGSKLRGQFDARQILANWAGVDLTRINGLGLTAVLKILSELGPDLSRFETVKHFCSWLGLCPGTKISGGKVLSAKTKRSANRVRQALKMAAMSLSHADSALGAFYRRLCSRMDKPSANTAVAHKLARMVYFMLTRGEDFVDQGQQRYEEQQHERSVAALKHCSRRDPNVQLDQKLIGDSLFASDRVLPGHSANELAQFFGDQWSTTSGFRPPQQGPAGSMPTQYSLRFHDYQRAAPVEQPRQYRQADASCRTDLPGQDSTFDIQRQLPAHKEILGLDGLLGPNQL